MPFLSFPPSAVPGVLRGGDVPVPPLLGGRTLHERGPEAAVDERRRGARLLPHRDRRPASVTVLVFLCGLTASGSACLTGVVGLEKGL